MSKDHFLEVTGLKKYFEADRPSFFSREARNCMLWMESISISDAVK